MPALAELIELCEAAANLAGHHAAGGRRAAHGFERAVATPRFGGEPRAADAPEDAPVVSWLALRCGD